ncbi:hypothetical protein ACHAWO_009818 [Cyclotella atomus]|uniref:UBA domain-containing protein n=1 Tax=Cyclotella atomus TaxID=382360 RepID=A0ABD3QJF2_9STRA
MNHKELILSILREQKIKLWLPPYHTSTPCQDALRSLSSSISSKILMRKHDDASNVIKLDTEAIYNLLIELQTPAVEKYIQKHSVDFKIVGIASTKDVKIPSDMSSRWGDKVSIHKNGKLMIRVVNISSTLTVEMLLDDLSTVFDGGVRMICRGKNLAAGCMRTIIGSDACAKKEVLCLVSPGTGPTGKRSSAAAAFSNVAPIDDVEREVPRTDATIIASVRQAAQTLEKSTTSRFEITDQSGRLVPMSQMDSSSFLTALGLHRLGRSKMEIKSTTIERTEQDASVSKEGIASALTFLLEADAEWNSSPALLSWRGKVDNYGLLQLDIAWCYLLLGSIENLPDAVERLTKAESVLRKQVHSNFVTLALAQADMNNSIPPLCSVFVRLYLLQGVAYKTIGNDAEATKRLGWARLLCQRLRESSPSDAVDELCGVYNTTDRSCVIAALRRSNGRPDEAGELISLDREERKAAAKKRRRQRKFGRCSNGSDWVNTDHVSPLACMLGMNVNESDLDSDSEDERKISMSYALLLVEELNRASGRTRRATTPKHTAKELDLVTMMSMGVEESLARQALEATGNVDAAVVWLSTVHDKEPADKYNNGEEPNSGNETSDNPMADAEKLLKNELGNALLGNSKNLEKEWLGVDLDDEWNLIENYGPMDA